MSDVYICHSPSDIVLAQKLMSFLELGGYSCTKDSNEAGKTKVFLLIHSKSSASSEVVVKLLSVASFSDKTVVIPYMADDTPLSPAFEFYLTGARRIEPDITNNDYAFEALGSAVKAIISQDGANPPAQPQPSGVNASAGSGPDLQNISFDPSQLQYHTFAQDNVGKKKSSKKLAVIISCIVGTLVIAGGVVAVVLIMNNNSKNIDEPSGGGSQTSQVSMASGSGRSDAQSKTIENYELSLQNKKCTGTYKGEVNENGRPDGSGVFEGTYSLDDESTIKIVYTGSFSDGEAVDSSGNATMNEEAPEGSSFIRKEYKGGIRNGLNHGSGKLLFVSNGEVIVSEEYEGDWENDVRSGSGKTTVIFPNGDKLLYDGDYENDSFSGKGTYTYEYATGDTDKKIYIGEFKNNMFNGKGICTIEYKDGSVGTYNGEWTNDTLAGNGTITITHKTGDLKSYEYVGELYEGMQHGSGKETSVYKNGDKIVSTGEWSMGKQTGNGTYLFTMAEGDTKSIEYKGSYADGKYSGTGTLVTTMRNGDVETKTGDWKEGKFSGKGKYSIEYKTGKVKSTVYEGRLNDSVMRGRGTYTVTGSDGQVMVYEGSWNGFELDGKMTKTNSKGKVVEVQEGKFKNLSIVSGTVKTYDENGKLLITESFGG